MSIAQRLKPGDLLLYAPQSVGGTLIAMKTWHWVGHVEIFTTRYPRPLSVASRRGSGVGVYPLREQGLIYALRPTGKWNHATAFEYARHMIGTPYGWWDLLNFFGLPVDGPGIVCSSFAAGFYRAGGMPIFPHDPINRIAPFQFLDLVGYGFEDIHIPEIQ